MTQTEKVAPEPQHITRKVMITYRNRNGNLSVKYCDTAASAEAWVARYVPAERRSDVTYHA